MRMNVRSHKPGSQNCQESQRFRRFRRSGSEARERLAALADFGFAPGVIGHCGGPAAVQANLAGKPHRPSWYSDATESVLAQLIAAAQTNPKPADSNDLAA